MSSLNFILSDVLDELYNKPSPKMVSELNSEISLFKNEVKRQPPLTYVPLQSGFFRSHINTTKSGVTLSKHDRSVFEINFDVKQFKPEEISVKVIGDHIVVTAKHESEDKHGYISHHFTRGYKLTDDVNIDDLTSTLSSDGILTLVATKKITQSQERNIPIVQTNEPALKSGKEDDNEESEKAN